MAAKKKKVRKKMVPKGPRLDDEALYAQLIGDMIDGLLGVVVALVESRNVNNGLLTLEYDEEVDDNT